MGGFQQRLADAVQTELLTWKTGGMAHSLAAEDRLLPRIHKGASGPSDHAASQCHPFSYRQPRTAKCTQTAMLTSETVRNTSGLSSVVILFTEFE